MNLSEYVAGSPLAGGDPYGLLLWDPEHKLYRGVKKAWDWLWGNSPAAVRTRGVGGAIAGGLEGVGGVAVAATAVVDGPVGVIGGTILVFHGSDVFWTSIEQIKTGQVQQTQTHKILALVLGEDWATVVEIGISLPGIVRGIVGLVRGAFKLIPGLRSMRRPTPTKKTISPGSVVRVWPRAGDVKSVHDIPSDFKNWPSSPLKRGDGIRYIDPSNPGRALRLYRRPNYADDPNKLINPNGYTRYSDGCGGTTPPLPGHPD